jgi:hypothetical protein
MTPACAKGKEPALTRQQGRETGRLQRADQSEPTRDRSHHDETRADPRGEAALPGTPESLHLIARRDCVGGVQLFMVQSSRGL